MPWSIANDDGSARFRLHLLRLSTCSPAQLEGQAREVLRAWLEHRAERKAVERDQRIGFGSAPRYVRWFESGTLATMSRLP